ncbi:MAG: UDP-N-acetylmuramoyl-L-alanyl-D-glutamate--2,6-diaminopimelate ligase, partial [candidate division WOR-3 bacterium]
IIDDIKAGIEKDNYEVQINRYAAIRRALFLASGGDIVLIAGKGHEDYQLIAGEKRHFDDEETVKSILAKA